MGGNPYFYFKKMKTTKKHIAGLSIPRKITLLGEAYTIQITPEIKRQLKGQGAINYCGGTINHPTKTITLRQGSHNPEYVLLHEFTHILNRLTGIGKYECNSEIFSTISGLFWGQVYRQLTPLKLIKLTRRKK